MVLNCCKKCFWKKTVNTNCGDLFSRLRRSSQCWHHGIFPMVLIGTRRPFILPVVIVWSSSPLTWNKVTRLCVRLENKIRTAIHWWRYRAGSVAIRPASPSSLWIWKLKAKSASIRVVVMAQWQSAYESRGHKMYPPLSLPGLAWRVVTEH